MSFDGRFEQLIGVEGRYANHPSDRGGETMWGITIEVARRNGYHGPMNQMPREVARDIYEEEYLKKPGFHYIDAISSDLATELFDTGVNMHPMTAIQFLQRSLNLLNRRGKDYTDLTVDASIGAKTINALKIYMQIRGKDAIPVLLKMLNTFQGAKYISLAENKETQEDFIFGWFRTRVEI